MSNVLTGDPATDHLLEEMLTQRARQQSPALAVLCGSTRFGSFFDKMNLKLTMEGSMVLSIGCVTTSDQNLAVTDQQKDALDLLHFHKILECAKRKGHIYFLNTHQHLGESTTRELRFALFLAMQGSVTLHYVEEDKTTGDIHEAEAPKAIQELFLSLPLTDVCPTLLCVLALSS